MDIEEKKIKVLIAEDEREILDTASEILRDEGFEVFSASNGKYAFEIFLDQNPDIIISDIMMPEIDGYGLLKMVRESKNKNNNIPFIFLTALNQKEHILKGVDFSANDYLLKPIDFDILTAKIKEKINNSLKIKKTHEAGINNIKKQISSILPNEIDASLNSALKMLQILKEEPYGPFSHRRYLEDINKLHNDISRLKIRISNSLDSDVIEKNLQENEEIFSLINFFDNAILNLPEKIKAKIIFDRPYDTNSFPKIKFDRPAMVEIVKKIISGVIRSGIDSSLRISTLLDNNNQMAVIFYLKSQIGIKNIETNIDYAKIEQIGESQNCNFKLSASALDDSEISLLMTIPAYRIIFSEKK